MKPPKSFLQNLSQTVPKTAYRCQLFQVREIQQPQFFNLFFMTLQRWLQIFQTWTEEDPFKNS